MCDLIDFSGKKIFLNNEVYLIEERRSITNSKNGIEAVFSSSEVSIIKELVMSGGKPVSRRYLLDTCWGGRVVTNTSLNVAINKIRERLNSVGLEDAIITVPRFGYQINLTDDEKLEVVPLFNQNQDVEQRIGSAELENDSMNNSNDEQDSLIRNLLKINSVNINFDYIILSMSWVLSTITLSLFFFNIHSV
ncbi:winged helix-turn-helix domain-containing protein (plasmid) [Photobacterium sp. DA100]|uniref:winged helix-turn-helix domain-containing protein n=1 Tax=Photobacterium sp. DA100 TaxID=3027472 RepID=UPI00247A1404|nr:winged helix-turn-helix domain-containing protein [Photobacterium sp. DA100]WEM45940.1 winged helix-turn-helix domain-containing protein [Photobacterium sp. DA100]